MSYILDALKKSERQRPPGQAPDLFTVQGPVAPKKSRRSLWASVVVASTIVAALGGWAWFEARDRRAQAPPDQAAAPRLPASGVTRPEAAAPAIPVAVTPAGTSHPATPPVVKVPAAVPPAPSNAERRAPGARSAGAVVAGPAAPPATVPSASPSEPVPEAVAAPAGASIVQTAAPASPELPAATLRASAPPHAAISPAATVPAVVAVPPVVLEIPPPIPVAVVAEPAATPHQPAADAPPADGRVVGIEDLPESVRMELGTFVVSGYVWSEEPALRLLTMKDRIVRVGNEAAPGVRLEEITQTGAVFTVRGWRFRTGF
jgi:general secretion pathway protein B